MTCRGTRGHVANMVSGEVNTSCARRCPKHALEVGRALNSSDHGTDPVSPKRADGVSEDSDCQTLAPLGATCIDDGAATTRLHADKKAMRAGAADFGSLVGTFHDLLGSWCLPRAPRSIRQYVNTHAERGIPAPEWSQWIGTTSLRPTWARVAVCVRETHYYTKKPLFGQRLAPCGLYLAQA